MPWKTIVYRRSELYEQVWTEPVIQLAKRYGVSNTAFAKTCRKLNVPRPSRGYWAKVEHGKSPRRAKLPPLAAGVPESLESKVWVPAEDLSPQPDVPAEVREAMEQERSALVRVPEQLERPHPLVVACRRALRLGTKTQYGLLSRGKQQALDITVSSGQLSRALRVTDTFLKACEKRGIRIELRKLPEDLLYYRRPRQISEDESRIVMGELDVEFRLREKTKAKKHEKEDREWFWRRDRYDPTGILELSFDSYPNTRTFRDSPRAPLENQLGEVFAWLREAAHKAAVRKEEARIAAIKQAKADAEAKRIREERERIRQEAERRAREERERQERLASAIERWRLARDIREFIAAAEARGRSRSLDPTVEWSLGYADAIDPLLARASEGPADEGSTKRS